MCRDSLEKTCSEDTVGETVCRTVYQTQCNTRYGRQAEGVHGDSGGRGDGGGDS